MVHQSILLALRWHRLNDARGQASHGEVGSPNGSAKGTLAESAPPSCERMDRVA